MDEVSCLNIIARAYSADTDQAFVYTTWRNGMYYGSKEMKKRDPKIAFKELTREIKDILKNATVRIACLEESPDVIVGYVVFTNKHLDWVYVKEEFRKQGVASLMVPKGILTVTPRITKIGQAIFKNKQGEEDAPQESHS